jgi:hypothetical protein
MRAVSVSLRKHPKTRRSNSVATSEWEIGTGGIGGEIACHGKIQNIS